MVVAITALPLTAAWFLGAKAFQPGWFVSDAEICRRNLEEVYAPASRFGSRPGKPIGNGPAFLLEFRKRREGLVGREEAFVCPNDDAATMPRTAEERAAYDAVVLRDPTTYEGLCSYAARDFVRFPLRRSRRVQIVAADRCGPAGRTPHHRGGLNVLLDDGKARFVTWEELGFPEDGPAQGAVIVGPGSPNAELAKLILPP